MTDVIQLPSGQRLPIEDGSDARTTLIRHSLAALGEGFCPKHGAALRAAAGPPADARDDNGEPWFTHEGCQEYWQVTTLDGEPAVSGYVAWAYEGRERPR
ncbi:MAG: hypothetical protein JWM93_2475 [Frankiales bacterium]|nr:hypothetical protein [Frankiales bacterium]